MHAAHIISILFLGNSHTFNNNVPGMVESLIDSDGAHQARIEAHFGPFLDDLARDPNIARRIHDGHWDFVVLQGARVSMSHKVNYSQEGPISLARMAKAAGARPLLYVEWPRRGWDESDYQMSIYRKTSTATKAELVPICYVWDAFRKHHPKTVMWMSDGNHAALPGSFLAACTFYWYMCGKHPGHPNWHPSQLDAPTAIAAIKESRAKLKALKDL